MVLLASTRNEAQIGPTNKAAEADGNLSTDKEVSKEPLGPRTDQGIWNMLWYGFKSKLMTSQQVGENTSESQQVDMRVAVGRISI
jgi:hypothetical protein